MLSSSQHASLFLKAIEADDFRISHPLRLHSVELSLHPRVLSLWDLASGESGTRSQGSIALTHKRCRNYMNSSKGRSDFTRFDPVISNHVHFTSPFCKQSCYFIDIEVYFLWFPCILFENLSKNILKVSIKSIYLQSDWFKVCPTSTWSKFKESANRFSCFVNAQKTRSNTRILNP